MSLISVQNVSKIFRQRKARSVLRERLQAMVAPASESGFYALRNVSFRVEPQESVALIGANGAGKSTMLALICGLASPDEGTVEVNGSIAPLLELASGFHQDLTGRENLFVNAALLGLNRARTLAAYQSILDFSEIAEFINEPLRTYSSGMILRLGFAIAVHCDPAIVIIDEVLGVGDSSFQRKCHEKILQLRAEGKTLLCVSHNSGLVADFCQKAVWLHQGELVLQGDATEVGRLYREFMVDPNAFNPLEVYRGGTKPNQRT